MKVRLSTEKRGKHGKKYREWMIARALLGFYKKVSPAFAAGVLEKNF